MAQDSELHRKKGGPGRPWKPGESGNPGGRPKGFSAFVRAKVGDSGEKLVEAALLIASGKPKERQAFFGENVRVTARERMLAVEYLTDRGWGKAPQTVELTGVDGEPIRVTFGGRYKPPERE